MEFTVDMEVMYSCIPHLSNPPIGIDLKVLDKVSGVLCHLFLKQLQETDESNLTEQVSCLLWGVREEGIVADTTHTSVLYVCTHIYIQYASKKRFQYHWIQHCLVSTHCNEMERYQCAQLLENTAYCSFSFILFHSS